MSAPVKVIQADREAAIAFGDRSGRIRVDLYGACISAGDWDRTEDVQAFAKHRLSTTEAMREALESVRDDAAQALGHLDEDLDIESILATICFYADHALEGASE